MSTKNEVSGWLEVYILAIPWVLVHPRVLVRHSRVGFQYPSCFGRFLLDFYAPLKPNKFVIVSY